MRSKAYEICNFYLVPLAAFCVYFYFLIIIWIPEIAGCTWALSVLHNAGQQLGRRRSQLLDWMVLFWHTPWVVSHPSTAYPLLHIRCVLSCITFMKCLLYPDIAQGDLHGLMILIMFSYNSWNSIWFGSNIQLRRASLYLKQVTIFSSLYNF